MSHAGGRTSRPAAGDGDVRNAIAEILDNTSLADVTKRQGAVRKILGLVQYHRQF